jgi:3-deoxy-manno-octulosonate cytidylyltransferase (CMP-KDO synthetase)
MIMKTIAIIPARYGSERLPAKPLADIAGKPMIQHVVERTARARCVNDVLVATDDERIVAAVQQFGGKALMTPADLKSGTDRVAFAARSLTGAEIIVNVQGDEPLIAPAMIDQAVEPLQQNESILAGTLVKEISTDEELNNPGVVKAILDRNGYCLYFSRSIIPFVRDVGQRDWRTHHTFYKHIGLYVFRRELLLRYATLPQTPLERAEKLEQLRLLEHGYPIKATITEEDSIPVDTPADLDKVRAIVENRHE